VKGRGHDMFQDTVLAYS